MNIDVYTLLEVKMSIRFEHSFSKMIDEILHGHFKSLKINLCEKPITKNHLNKLAHAFEENFQIASRITEIDLSFTGIHDLPTDIFRNCDSLRRLNLENNKLKKLPPLPDRPYALQDFVASFNPLKDLPAHYFANCISLRTVYLNSTHLEHAPSFADSLSLTWLHLNSNPIKKFPEKYFLYLDHLDTVFINNTELKEVPDLSHCKRLQEVWIDDIKVPAKHITDTIQVIIARSH